jgi:hypothetical protein
MDLQELQERLRQQEQLQQEQQAMLQLLSRDMREKRTRTSLSWLTLKLWLELAFALFPLLLLISYLADVLWTPRFSIPALVLIASLLWMLSLLIRQLHLLQGIDYSAPVIAIQRALAQLTLLREREVKWIILLCPLLWPPLLMVFLHGVLGLDPFKVLNPAWLASNIIFGISASILLWWMSRHLSKNYPNTAWILWLKRHIAGDEISVAQASLAHYATFERE